MSCFPTTTQLQKNHQAHGLHRVQAWGVALIARTALDKNPSEELRTFIVQTAISSGLKWRYFKMTDCGSCWFRNCRGVF